MSNTMLFFWSVLGMNALSCLIGWFFGYARGYLVGFDEGVKDRG